MCLANFGRKSFNYFLIKYQSKHMLYMSYFYDNGILCLTSMIMVYNKFNFKSTMVDILVNTYQNFLSFRDISFFSESNVKGTVA